MTTICLIRHGETEWNAAGILQGTTDIPLNAKGVKQAEACSVYLASSSYDVLISSPLKRAKQTAEIINQKLGLPFHTMSEFQERAFGAAEGMTYEARRAEYPKKKLPGPGEGRRFSQKDHDGSSKSYRIVSRPEGPAH
jgi:uncharacterized phosphatase